jgi:sodium pump decarboxylase gamma subunit
MNATIAEKFSFVSNVSLVAMLIVFAILVILMFIIKLQSSLLKNMKREPVAEKPQVVENKAKVEDALEVVDINREHEIVASIMAALSAHLGKPIDGLNIKSIKRINNVNSNWQKTSIEDKVNN